MDVYAPVKGKCTWWREVPDEGDRWDRSVKSDAKRVQCMCFVEGGTWQFKRMDVPRDCPDSRHCRYHIKAD